VIQTAFAEVDLRRWELWPLGKAPLASARRNAE
jgi:hypothetical protein